MTTLNLNSVAFTYGQQAVLRDINLTLETGQIGCLLGPSGCGKSTLLRLIAGFEKPHSGAIYIANQLVADNSQTTEPQQRQVGMLFQDLALFPHLSVTDNIAFGLHQLTQSQQQLRVDELLKLCRLEAYKSRYPHQLSGGQCQRVALARAMAPKPKLILLDEPFSSVETGLQSELVHEVKTMLQADQSTALWVTHSMEEAFAVADQMGVMLDGELLQWSSPSALYNEPKSTAVIGFLNHLNLVDGTINNEMQIATAIGVFDLVDTENLKPGRQAQIAINKQHLDLDQSGQTNAIVNSAVYQGGQYLISATLNNSSRVQFYHEMPLTPQQPIALKVLKKSVYHGFQK